MTKVPDDHIQPNVTMSASGAARTEITFTSLGLRLLRKKLYSTVTLLARLRGLSTSRPRLLATR